MQVGSKVIVRDNMAGVHFGILEELDMAAKTCTLRGARKVWSWEGAGSCHGLAAHGPRTAKCPPAVDEVAMCNVVEVVLCSEAAWAKLTAVPEWRP